MIASGERWSIHRREFLRAALALTAGVIVGPLTIAEAHAREPISLVPGVLGLVWGPVVIRAGARARVVAVAPRDLHLLSINTEASGNGLILEQIAHWSGHGLPLESYKPHGVCFDPGYHGHGCKIENGREIGIGLYNPKPYDQTFIAAAL